jgi:hypothetical protein
MMPFECRITLVGNTSEYLSTRLESGINLSEAQLGYTTKFKPVKFIRFARKDKRLSNEATSTSMTEGDENCEANLDGFYHHEITAHVYLAQ